MKKDQYFLKDKKIKLITKTSERDSIGQTITAYKYISNKKLWAYARQLSQDQIFQAAAYSVDETRFFVINNRKDLAVYDFIEYKGKYYSITRIDTRDDYNGDMFLYVKDAPRGDTPKNIKPAND